jgi:hypothetical protein
MDNFRNEGENDIEAGEGEEVTPESTPEATPEGTPEGGEGGEE